MSGIAKRDEAFVVISRNVVYSDSHESGSVSELEEKIACAADSAPTILGVFTTMALASQCLMHNSVSDNEIIEIVQTMVDQPTRLFSLTVKTHRKRKCVVVESTSNSSTTSDEGDSSCENVDETSKRKKKGVN
jgi:hypothetical protein